MALQADAGLKLLLIDNVSAFYWLDRDVKPSAPGAGGSPTASHHVHPVHHHG